MPTPCQIACVLPSTMQLSGMLEKMLAGEAHLTTPIKANTNLPLVFLSVHMSMLPSEPAATLTAMRRMVGHQLKHQQLLFLPPLGKIACIQHAFV
jgi:hypothetical protein